MGTVTMAVIAKVLPNIATSQPSINIPVFVRIQIIDLSFVDSSARINSLMSASSRVVLSVSDLFTSERVCVQRAAIHCWYIHFAQFTVALAPTPSVFKPLPSNLRQRSSLDRR